jgi:hypothetical protein
MVGFIWVAYHPGSAYAKDMHCGFIGYSVFFTKPQAFTDQGRMLYRKG